MKFSSIPILFLAICIYWAWAARDAGRRGDIASAHVRAIYIWLASLTAWGLVSTELAIQGIYASDEFYRLFPGFWVPLAPVMLSVTLLAVWPTFRAALRIVAETTSPRAFLLVHGLRIAAIGGIFKAYHGLLPTSFVYTVGIPDFVFGLLSLLLALMHGKNGYSTRLLIGWNLLGIGVLSSAPLMMQMGLPGPLYIFASQPDARALFDFPMVLAPTLVVTLLFFMNGWQSFVLWSSAGRSTARPARAER